MCCRSMCLFAFSALIGGYVNLAFRLCAADPHSKTLGAAVASQSKKSDNLGGVGTVYNNNS